VTKVERAQDQAWEYLRQIIGTRYELWTGGPVPAGAPAWGRNGERPDPGEVRRTTCFCAGVTNLARRAVGLEIPTLGNENFDGGVVAYFGAADPAPQSSPARATSTSTAGSAGSISKKHSVPGLSSGASSAAWVIRDTSPSCYPTADSCRATMGPEGNPGSIRTLP
jgi:hypothetical protein